jgi:DNA-binding MarR family transcriptional regulator
MRREESLGYLVNHLARQLARALHERIAPLGVVPGQFAQLLALYEHDGITQQDLCEIVGIEQPTMANTLGRMERDGLVERRPHPSDGRKQLIHLTDKARALEGPLTEAAESVNTLATAGLSETERSTLMGLIATVQANLDESTRSGNIIS